MGEYEQFHLNNFGHGYDSFATPEELADNAMATGSLDVELGTSGSVRKRNGYRRVVTTTWETATVDGYTETLGLHQFHDPAELRCLIRIARRPASDAIRFEWNDADFPGTEASVWNEGTTMLVDSATFSGASEEYCMFVGGRSATNGPALYVACPGFTGSGSNSPVKYLTYASGFTVRSMTTTGSTRTLNLPSGIEQWYDRIWVFCKPSVEQGTYLLYSDVNGEAFDLGSTGTWLEVPGQGPITAIKRLGRNLIVFKGSSTYVLSGGEDPTNLLRIDQLSASVGCLARRSVVEVDGILYFYGERGFYMTDGFKVEYIGQNVENELKNLDRTLINRLHAANNRAKDHVAFFVPLGAGVGLGYGLSGYGEDGYGDGTSEQRCLVYDYGNKVWCPPWTGMDFIASAVVTNQTAVTSEDEEIVVVGATSTDNGHLYQFAYGLRDDDADFTGVVVTKPFSLGDPSRRKHLRKVYVQAGVEEADSPMVLEIHAVYGDIDTATFSQGFTLSNTVTGARNFAQARYTVSAAGKHFQFKLYDTTDSARGTWTLNGLIGLFVNKARKP